MSRWKLDQDEDILAATGSLLTIPGFITSADVLLILLIVPGITSSSLKYKSNAVPLFPCLYRERQLVRMLTFCLRHADLASVC